MGPFRHVGRPEQVASDQAHPQRRLRAARPRSAPSHRRIRVVRVVRRWWRNRLQPRVPLHVAQVHDAGRPRSIRAAGQARWRCRPWCVDSRQGDGVRQWIGRPSRRVAGRGAAANGNQTVMTMTVPVAEHHPAWVHPDSAREERASHRLSCCRGRATRRNAEWPRSPPPR